MCLGLSLSILNVVKHVFTMISLIAIRSILKIPPKLMILARKLLRILILEIIGSRGCQIDIRIVLRAIPLLLILESILKLEFLALKHVRAVRR